MTKRELRWLSYGLKPRKTVILIGFSLPPSRDVIRSVFSVLHDSASKRSIFFPLVSAKYRPIIMLIRIIIIMYTVKKTTDLMSVYYNGTFRYTIHSYVYYTCVMTMYE